MGGRRMMILEKLFGVSIALLVLILGLVIIKWVREVNK
jgi:hypothetical protein